MLISFVNSLGAHFILICSDIGQFTLFFMSICRTLISTRLKFHKTFVQMVTIGINSIYIVVLTGAFSGGVLALQSYIGLKRFGGEEFIGPLIAASLTRELGPVLTGLMVTGRAGSAIAAELGTMQISEQIDALKTLCVDINQYLMVPRILGATIIMPFVTVFCMICGIVGGYVVATSVLNLSGEQYRTGIKVYLELSDITGGLIKAAAFGLIFSTIGCYKGYGTLGGAKGVGISTTQSVVYGSIFILIANYFLTAMLF